MVPEKITVKDMQWLVWESASVFEYADFLRITAGYGNK